MQSVLKHYPEVPWKSGWRFTAGPEDRTPFVTGTLSGALAAPDQIWTLQLIDPEAHCTTRLFANGFSIGARRRPEKNRIDALIISPGLLGATLSEMPPPRLTADTEIKQERDIEWLQSGSGIVLLLRQESRFVLVCGEPTFERALAKAEAALDLNFDQLMQTEAEERKKVRQLFSLNPRHNPPVALAAETLAARLRERTGTIHGLWSLADGFPVETFSLNELYPLIHAWSLIDPPVARDLMQTAMSLQQSTGGFPSWIGINGLVSPVAPWPLIAQSFELMWQNERDPALLKKHLPALRKYVQWAVRHFDPRRDRIPAWQSEQEIFIPGSYERGKAMPELTVFLLNELDSVLRLCKETEQAEATEQSLIDEREQLARTLDTVFWNPAAKAFSNAWKDGHYLHEPSFGSFMPLLWRGLDKEKQTALLENFEETHGFPGHRSPATWKLEEIDDTSLRPAIHQFMAFEAIRAAKNASGLLMLFVRRAREGFAAWFERESLQAARGEPSAGIAYALGPVTASLILTTQAEFVREASNAPTAAQLFLRGVHRLRLKRTDLRLTLVFLLTIFFVHLIYTLPRNRDVQARVAEAALNYQQGRFTEALRLCRRYPHNPLSNFLQANIMMIANRPDQAEPLYRQALTQKTASPAALFGMALALQMNGKFDLAEKRYSDFIAIHGQRYAEAAKLADEFMLLAHEKFSTPPRWRRIYALPMMNDLGL